MAAKPTIAKFCADFLGGDMLHIFRQVEGLQAFRPVVLTRKRQHEDLFPFDPARIELMPRASMRNLKRIWYRQLLGRPIPAGGAEVNAALNALKKHDAKLLHVYFGNVAADLLPLLRRCPVPVVISIHGADAAVDMDRPGFRAVFIKALNHAALVCARSESLLAQLRELGVDEDKLRLQRTGLPLDEWPFLPRPVPPKEGKWRILQVCRLVPKKGLATSLRAFAEIRKHHPKAVLTLAGEGEGRLEMGALAVELGIADGVEFPGFADQALVRRLAGKAHLFFHPSETDAAGNCEGVPNSMLEAMATGLPTLATYHGGIPEVVEDEVSGLLVNEGDHQALADGALRLMGNPEAYARVGEAGRRAVEAGFSRQASISNLEAIYAEAIDRG